MHDAQGIQSNDEDDAVVVADSEGPTLRSWSSTRRLESKVSNIGIPQRRPHSLVPGAATQAYKWMNTSTEASIYVASIHGNFLNPFAYL